MSDELTLKAVCDRIITEWSACWPCRFASDADRRVYFARICDRHSPDPATLLKWWIAFKAEAKGRPELRDWQKWLERQEAEARARRRRYMQLTQEHCAFCGVTGRMELVVPFDLRKVGMDRYRVSCRGYSPGEPFDLGRLNVETLFAACKCQDVDGETLRQDVLELREAHERWYVRAMEGKWPLEPGWEQDGAVWKRSGVTPPSAAVCYRWRLRANVWEPTKPGQPCPAMVRLQGKAPPGGAISAALETVMGGRR